MQVWRIKRCGALFFLCAIWRNSVRKISWFTLGKVRWWPEFHPIPYLWRNFVGYLKWAISPKVAFKFSQAAKTGKIHLQSDIHICLWCSPYLPVGWGVDLSPKSHPRW